MFALLWNSNFLNILEIHINKWRDFKYNKKWLNTITKNQISMNYEYGVNCYFSFIV